MFPLNRTLATVIRSGKNGLIRCLPFFTRHRPALIDLFITSRCNLRCRHCFYGSDQRTDQEPELTIKEIEKISQALPSFPWLLISGGEPFLRDDIAEITRIFLANNHVSNVTIPTNGMFPDKIIQWIHETEKFDAPTQYNLNFSFHGLEETHDAITRVTGSFQRLIKTISQVQGEIADPQTMRIVFNVTMMRHNQENLIGLLQHLHEHYPSIRINLGLIRGKARDVYQKDIDPEKYLQAASYINSHPYRDSHSYFLARFFSARNRFMHKRIYQTLTNSVSYRPCLAGKLSMVINEHGDVFACELINQTFGNVKDYDYQFQKLWRSKKRHEVLEKITSDCCLCTHECNQTVNNLYDPLLLLAQTYSHLFNSSPDHKNS